MSNQTLLLDEFKLVTGKKKIKRKINTSVKCTSFPLCEDNDKVDENLFLRRLEKIRNELQTSEYFIQCFLTINKAICTANLNKHEQIYKFLCFGIGSFTTCIAAQHQLAFSLELCKKIGISYMKYYDPIFTENEKTILKLLKCKLMNYNCSGKYPIDEKYSNIVYLPHCPNQLTNNFLWKNWNIDCLKKSILICNSFEQLLVNTPEKTINQQAQYIKRIVNFVHEFPLNNCYHFKDIFNDTSVHIFVSNEKNEVNHEFWVKENEPEYCDIEFITLSIK